MQKEHLPDVVQSIDDYLNGKLDTSQVDALWVYLMQHPEYYSLLETQAALKRIDIPEFREKLADGHDFNRYGDDSDRGLVRESRTAWAGALAAVLVITLLINVFRSTVETELAPAISQIHPAQLISPDVSRSSTEDLSGFDRGLYRAYLLSISGNLDDALAEYEQLSGVDEPERSWVRYNQAILHFNRGDHAASARLFEQVDCSGLDHAGRTESCYWFKTNSFVAYGDLERAWDAGNKTLERAGFYQHDAIEMLRKIRHIREDLN
jgi:tetratricopeptide (TPR) repeat protein